MDSKLSVPLAPRGETLTEKRHFLETFGIKKTKVYGLSSAFNPYVLRHESRSLSLIRLKRQITHVWGRCARLHGRERAGSCHITSIFSL